MQTSPAVEATEVTFRYGERIAVDGFSLRVERSEIFALLGPNGGGKTTLFKLISTLAPMQGGTLSVLGRDVMTDWRAVRGGIGVVFQAPSLDKKLTVAENLRHQGRLYGLSGRTLRERAEEMLARLGVADRRDEYVETLSGGLQRRVELAKGMLHRPALLLMDEPSTGLDPGARSSLWEYLKSIQRNDGVTILLTTHLLEEAERADRIAIIDQGKLIALGPPEELRSSVGGDTISLESDEPEALAKGVAETFSLDARVIDGVVHIEQPEGHLWVSRLVEAFPGRIKSTTVSKPSLEDVFIKHTGHRFWHEHAS